MHFRFIKNKLKLAASIAEIAALQASKKDQKTTGRAAELMDKAPGAAAKLKANGGEVMCLTVVEIFAVALRYFGKALNKGLKSSLVDQLRALIDKNPGIYENLTAAAPVAAALPAAAPVAAALPAAASPAAPVVAGASPEPSLLELERALDEEDGDADSEIDDSESDDSEIDDSEIDDSEIDDSESDAESQEAKTARLLRDAI